MKTVREVGRRYIEWRVVFESSRERERRRGRWRERGGGRWRETGKIDCIRYLITQP